MNSKSSATQPATSILDPMTVPLEPWPIPAELVREGSPEAKGMVIARSEDRRTLTGVWECSPGIFDWDYTWDETLTVVAGRVMIKDKGGTSQTFRAGDVVHLPVGLKTTWTVHETIRKVFGLISLTPVDL